jgi:hypothetical protein
MRDYQRMDRRRRGVPLQGSRGDKKKAQRFRARAQRTADLASVGTKGASVFIVATTGEAMVDPAYYQRKSLLREAYENGDSSGIIQALLAYTVPDGECRLWSRSVREDGYGKVNIGPRTHQPHRLMGEALFGPLHGEPIHHKCANPRCIAPNHMQRVSHRENTAEMLARQWYIKRIAALEAALIQAIPEHPLLTLASPVGAYPGA